MARLWLEGVFSESYGKLKFVETKTPKTRSTKALPHVGRSALAAHCVQQDKERKLAGTRWKETGYVFTTSVGTPIDKRNLIRTFHSIIRRFRLPHLRFHDLRHSAATLLLTQGVHPRAVMDLLGHSEINLTMNTYSHVLPVVQREVADRMDAILNPAAVNLAVKSDTDRPN